MRLWTTGSTPRSWVWGGGGGAGARGRVPLRQSTCQLELDASVEHILNRQQVGGRGGGARGRAQLRDRRLKLACPLRASRVPFLGQLQQQV